ncbi:MAG: hypothetical protein ACXW3H_01040, partial [Candidatus Aminicenantales bacterium]
CPTPGWPTGVTFRFQQNGHLPSTAPFSLFGGGNFWDGGFSPQEESQGQGQQDQYPHAVRIHGSISFGLDSSGKRPWDYKKRAISAIRRLGRRASIKVKGMSSPSLPREALESGPARIRPVRRE